MSVRHAIAASERTATRHLLGVLRREVGTLGSLGVLARVGAEKLAGEPFKRLGPPEGERDRLSRRQCGDLVLLDRALEARVGRERALSIAREVVLVGGVDFLERMLPAMDPEALAGSARELAKKFFNAEGELAEQADGSVRFDVRRCRFVDLLSEVDAAHLAPLFCEVDGAFFDAGRRPIALVRTTTLAQGGPRCDFHFTRRNDEAGRGSR